jgi:hypothetical protein
VVFAPLDDEPPRGQEVPDLSGGLVELDVQIFAAHPQHRVQQRRVRVVGDVTQVQTGATVGSHQHTESAGGLRSTHRRPSVRTVLHHGDHECRS